MSKTRWWSLHQMAVLLRRVCFSRTNTIDVVCSKMWAQPTSSVAWDSHKHCSIQECSAFKHKASKPQWFHIMRKSQQPGFIARLVFDQPIQFSGTPKPPGNMRAVEKCSANRSDKYD